MAAKKVVFLVDGNNHIHSDYHGAGDKAYDVFRARLMAMWRHFQPTKLIVCFDQGESFRQHIDANYKGGRPDKPSDLKRLLDTTPERLRQDGWSVASADSFEAEDVIATLCKEWRSKEHKVAIVSGDKDVMQLLERDWVTVLRKYSKQEDGSILAMWFTQDDLYEKTGLTPEQWVDYLAFAGDSGDNVKGAEGIGDVTARELLRKHGSLDWICANVWKLGLTPKKRNAVVTFGRNLANHLSLVRLRTDVPVAA